MHYSGLYPNKAENTTRQKNTCRIIYLQGNKTERERDRGKERERSKLTQLIKTL